MARPFLGSLTVLALVVSWLPAARAAEEADYRALNAAAVHAHVLPRYDAFAAATMRLAVAADAACRTVPARDLAALRQAFADAADAWQEIQHVRFGPIEFFSRASRIAFWPDPRNTVGRQLAELLAKTPAAEIAAESLAKGSVAVQGFPALERLLYEESAAGKLAAPGADAEKRCAAIRAVAGNLAAISRDVAAEWRKGGDGMPAYADDLLAAGPGHTVFRRHREATVELFKALHTAVELVADHKLARPLGPNAREARPRLAESWRSGRSLANIRANLAAARDLYRGAMSAFVRETAGNAELDALLTRAFDQTLASAEAIPTTLEATVTDAGLRPQVETLAREAKALKALLAQRLAPALDVPVGFNALDGD